ncbi:DUF1150 family protein [Shimia biformata]|uniref:DUF1150 family protein n=1 Tax=Shimia biformata TaxID=1294299 RepID=UPI00194DB393|nr:DUF1150 family protein [Shimia biformata]
MYSKYDFGDLDNDRIVYVREVNVDELPEELRDQAMGATRLYAVHAQNGDRLALVKDRKLAFVLARQNDFAPVTVH